MSDLAKIDTLNATEKSFLIRKFLLSFCTLAVLLEADFFRDGIVQIHFHRCRNKNTNLITFHILITIIKYLIWAFILINGDQNADITYNYGR